MLTQNAVEKAYVHILTGMSMLSSQHVQEVGVGNKVVLAVVVHCVMQHSQKGQRLTHEHSTRPTHSSACYCDIVCITSTTAWLTSSQRKFPRDAVPGCPFKGESVLV